MTFAFQTFPFFSRLKSSAPSFNRPLKVSPIPNIYMVCCKLVTKIINCHDWHQGRLGEISGWNINTKDHNNSALRLVSASFMLVMKAYTESALCRFHPTVHVSPSPDLEILHMVIYALCNLLFARPQCSLDRTALEDPPEIAVDPECFSFKNHVWQIIYLYSSGLENLQDHFLLKIFACPLRSGQNGFF